MRRWPHHTSSDLWVAAHPTPSEPRGCCLRSHRSWASSKLPPAVRIHRLPPNLLPVHSGEYPDGPAAGEPPGPPGPRALSSRAGPPGRGLQAFSGASEISRASKTSLVQAKGPPQAIRAFRQVLARCWVGFRPSRKFAAVRGQTHPEGLR